MNLVETETCPICGSNGHLEYDGQPDRLFSAEGVWPFWSCGNRDCGILWLNPRPGDEDLGLAYAEYYTHGGSAAASPGSGAEGASVAKKKRGMLRLSKAVFRLVRDPFRWVLRGLGKTGDLLPGLAYQTAARDGVDGPALRFLAGLCPARKAETDFGLFYLPVKKIGRLLDVGCGDGVHVERLNAMGWLAEGTEVDSQAVQQGRAKGLTIHQGALGELDLPPASYDAVVACHVLEHVPDPMAFLRSAYALVAPGGTLVVITPNRSALGHRLFGNAWLHLDPPRHLHIHTTQSLRGLAQGVSGDQAEVGTTVRDIANSYAASWDIRMHGRHAWGCRRSLFSMATFRLLATVAGWAHLIWPSLGEELVLKIHRPT